MMGGVWVGYTSNGQKWENESDEVATAMISALASK